MACDAEETFASTRTSKVACDAVANELHDKFQMKARESKKHITLSHFETLTRNDQKKLACDVEDSFASCFQCKVACDAVAANAERDNDFECWLEKQYDIGFQRMHGVSCEGNTNLACDATNTLPSNESCNAEKNDALSKKDK